MPASVCIEQMKRELRHLNGRGCMDAQVIAPDKALFGDRTYLKAEQLEILSEMLNAHDGH